MKNVDYPTVYEWRIYAMVPERLHEYLEIVNVRMQKIRQDNFGRLVGFWLSVLDDTCEVHHLWEFASLDTRQNLRRQLALKQDWQDFLKDVAPAIKSQQITFMRAHAVFQVPPSPSRIFKMIRYRTAVGKAQIVADEILRQPPSNGTVVRVSMWCAEAPDPNEVIELLAMNEHSACFAEVDDQESIELRCKLRDLIAEQRSARLLPVSFSPLR